MPDRKETKRAWAGSTSNGVVTVLAWDVGFELDCSLQKAGQLSDGPEKLENIAYIPHSSRPGMSGNPMCSHDHRHSLRSNKFRVC